MAVQDGVGPEPALGAGDAVLVEPRRDRARAGRGSPGPAPRRPRYGRRPGARPQAAPGRRGGEPRSRPRPPRRGRRRRSSSLAFGVLAADAELILDGGRPLLVGRVAGVERTAIRSPIVRRPPRPAHCRWRLPAGRTAGARSAGRAAGRGASPRPRTALPGRGCRSRRGREYARFAPVSVSPHRLRLPGFRDPGRPI